MIGYLAGEILEHQEGKMLLMVGTREAGGVGYAVSVPQSLDYGSLQSGQRVELFVYTHVREDALDLYGFSSKMEKSLFMTLLNVSGIGPKSALGILSSAEPSQLVQAIIDGNQNFLTQIPGIGKKTAERVLVELRDSIKKKMESGVLLKTSSLTLGGTTSQDLNLNKDSRIFEDAKSALVSLGYRENDVHQLLNRVIQTTEAAPKKAEDLIRNCIKTACHLIVERAFFMSIEFNDLTGPRIISPEIEASGSEQNLEKSLRPAYLEEYIGQKKVKENLSLFMEAARGRGDALDHVLLAGPPGLGKTTLAHIIAHEMGTQVHTVTGPNVEKKGDLAAILTNLQPKDVLFIDEIHRLQKTIEEVLYGAMEDFKLDLIIGQGPAARTLRIDLPKFTLVGATTRTGLLSSPLRDRFGVQLRLDFYPSTELEKIINRSAKLLNIEMDPSGASEIAKRSRGTPRIANRLLKRVRDFAQVKGKALGGQNNRITQSVAQAALNLFEVDHRGLDPMDRKFLLTIIEKFDGGPVGIDTLSSAIGEEKDTLEDVYEPYLIQEGFLQRTSRGRIATRLAFEHLGKVWTDPNPSPNH